MNDQGGVGLVRVAGAVYRLAVLRDKPGRVAAALAHAKATVGHVECLCSSPPRRLVIRTNRKTGRYHVARWPGDLEHDGECAFHRLDESLTGRSAYGGAAIVETEDGFSIRLSAPLTRVTAERRTPTPRPRAVDADPRAPRRAVGLLGLLHLLLEESRLTVWRKGARDRGWGECVVALRRVAGMCQVTGGRALGEVMYVVPRYTGRQDRDAGRQDGHGEGGFEEFFDRLRPSRASVPRGLMLGEIRDVRPAKYNVAYHLANHAAPVFVAPDLDRAARASYPAAFAEAGRAAGGRRLALLLVERASEKNLRVVDMAVALTTAHRIPVDSSLELVMADALVSHGRGFVKPLRFDAAHEVVLPDFILTDTEPHIPVEVYGVRGREAYDQRKAEKEAIYRAAGQFVVTWDGRGKLPDLTVR
ncbi:DUF1173 family protein [Nocardia sp. NPDC059246]|uniref:DUF1173 family protein n=1 Tax=unclassified Nocardia TaxID=2637762 RepID=UPI0036A30CE4